MKLKDDRKTTEEWLKSLIQMGKFRKVTPKQLDCMVKIWDYLVEHEQYDYTMGDLRAAQHNIPSWGTMNMAVWNLQLLGLIRQYRFVNNSDTYQVATWKPLA